ncbi:MAG: response regulator [Actinomycetota bacterium]|nr:response regulator [Actinomycetota bacterium]
MIINKVLLVDDEDDIRFVAEISLRDVGGLETFVASSGPEGLQSAEENLPDLIVLDMMMPGMDGMETLRQLRSNPATDHIPVIFMTARAQVHEITSYIEAGALAVITKPFDPMSLHEQVKQAAASLN